MGTMKKPLAAGVSKKSPKAGPVDAKGAYTKVQERTLGNMKKGGKIKKAQEGMTMKQLKSKYPDADTTAKGDVRGTEMNSGAPKKALDRYNDTYNAFDKKYKGGAAKDKPSKMKMKMGGKVSKMVSKVKSKMMSKKK
jgi:hypothetical protein